MKATDVKRKKEKKTMKKSMDTVFGWVAVAAMLCAVACESPAEDSPAESPGEGNGTKENHDVVLRPLVLKPEGIVGYYGPKSTRAEDGVKPAEALQTYTLSGFEDGAEIGFFSDGGKPDPGGDYVWRESEKVRDAQGSIVEGKYRFNNERLVFGNGAFTSDIFQFYDENSLGRSFSYYPYRENIENEGGVSVFLSEDEIKDAKYKQEKIARDFLITQRSRKDGINDSGSRNFYHAFSVVRIRLGKGYEELAKGDSGKNPKVYVQLKKMVKALRIDWDHLWNESTDLYLAMRLIYDDDVSTEARRLRALPTTATYDGREETVFDVVVPCFPMIDWRFPSGFIGSNSMGLNPGEAGGVTVESIILRYDSDDGETELELPVDNSETFVQTFEGSSGSPTTTHRLRGTFFYTVLVEKVGLNTTVRSYDVQSWKTGEIPVTMPNGITSVDDFSEFLLVYNRLFPEKANGYTSEEISQKLQDSESDDVKTIKKFGDTAKGGYEFTIYITADIDYRNAGDNSSPRISHMYLPIDGRGHTLANVQLSGGGFIGTMHSALKDIRFEGLRVTQSSDRSAPIGLIADVMESGSQISGVTVEGGWLQANASSAVGAAVGEMKGGDVSRSKFSGYILFGNYNPNEFNGYGLAGQGEGTFGEGNVNNMQYQSSGSVKAI